MDDLAGTSRTNCARRWIERRRQRQSVQHRAQLRGRAEIVDARAARRVGIRADDLDEPRFASFLYTAGQPRPRSANPHERRDARQQLPPWQIAYAEIYVTRRSGPTSAAATCSRRCSHTRSANGRYGGISSPRRKFKPARNDARHQRCRPRRRRARRHSVPSLRPLRSSRASCRTGRGRIRTHNSSGAREPARPSERSESRGGSSSQSSSTHAGGRRPGAAQHRAAGGHRHHMVGVATLRLSRTLQEQRSIWSRRSTSARRSDAGRAADAFPSEGHASSDRDDRCQATRRSFYSGRVFGRRPLAAGPSATKEAATGAMALTVFSG